MTEGEPQSVEATPAFSEATETQTGLVRKAPPVDAAPLSQLHLKSVLESVIFASDRALTPAQLARIVASEVSEVRALLEALVTDYAGRGVELVSHGGAYRFRTRPANAPFVRDLVSAKPTKLSRTQLETLAIIAYRQPITRPELEEIRGVDSGNAVKILCERGLAKAIGRKEEPGRPLIYGTSRSFLELFGFESLRDLPTLQEFTELSDDSKDLFERRMQRLETIRGGALPPAATPAEAVATSEPLAATSDEALEAVVVADESVDLAPSEVVDAAFSENEDEASTSEFSVPEPTPSA